MKVKRSDYNTAIQIVNDVEASEMEKRSAKECIEAYNRAEQVTELTLIIIQEYEERR